MEQRRRKRRDTLAYLNAAREKFRALAEARKEANDHDRVPTARRPALAGAVSRHAAAAAGRAAKFGVDDLARIEGVSRTRPLADGEYVVYSVSDAEPRGGQGAIRPLARALGRQRQAAADEHAERRRIPAGVEPRWPVDRLPVGSRRRGRRNPGLAHAGRWRRSRGAHGFPGRRHRISTGRPTASGSRSIANDPERPEGAEEPKQPEPIVINRYYFKEDYDGWVTDRRQHLYLFEIARQESESAHEGRATMSRCRPGRRTARASPTSRSAVPRRIATSTGTSTSSTPRAGAEERRLTTFAGADNDPSLESRPAWSPDGKRIAYLQAGEDKWIYYAPWSARGRRRRKRRQSRGPQASTAVHTRPRSRADGKALFALDRGEPRHARLAHRARDGAVTRSRPAPRFDYAFDVARRRTCRGPRRR